ncbi:MAG: DUF2730 domain-containing protein [Alphaproteobacteria bacterium HGW-Alphaproteobacteria-2]|nr:MAG: DUF2730 domain-containing protein [Alphaproteobacteria bacterium HGW-Alphaproteobacteria-2]
MLVAVLRTRRQAIDGRFDGIELEVKAAVAAGSARIDRHELRLQSIEQTVRGLPGRDDLHGLQLEMARIGGSLQTMQAVMEGNSQIMRRLEAIVTRHEEHLLDGGKR